MMKKIFEMLVGSSAWVNLRVLGLPVAKGELSHLLGQSWFTVDKWQFQFTDVERIESQGNVVSVVLKRHPKRLPKARSRQSP